MSSIFRRSLLCLVAVFAMSAVAASAALADAGQELVNSKKEAAVKKKVTGKSGISTLTVAGISVTSPKSKATSEVNGKSTVAKAVVTFEESEANNAGKKCKVKSPGSGAEGKIVTKPLKGELGEVAKGEATSEVGELFQPEAGSEFVQLEGTCIVTTKVTGNIAGEATPTKKLEKTGTLDFKITGGKQNIKEIETSKDVKVKPSLKAFGLAATQVTKQENTFEETLELIPGV